MSTYEQPSFIFCDGEPDVTVIDNGASGVYHAVPWQAGCHIEAAREAGHIRLRRAQDAKRQGHRPCGICFSRGSAA